ncbi:GAF domain-containing sensor histidine kinase [Candidatus Microgenomates bacterium]|nr:GAF domain-containing sensor histidine kinase [Candidatus Microgenomates bacterium]
MITLLLFIASLTIFALLSIYFARQEEKTRQEKTKQLLEKREKELNRRLYETAILKEIADRIGYSLDVEKIVDIITGSLRNLFPYSTASSLMVTPEALTFKTYVEENVSNAFVNEVKNRLLTSLEALLNQTLPEKVNESISGVVLDDNNKNPLASFFNIPLVINEQVVGLINVASQQAGLYQEEEMSILYRIASQASQAVSKLESILETEKGKIMAMISSLADGVFMVDVDTKLAVINPKALSMLRITSSSPTIFDIIDSLTGKFDIRTKIEEAIIKNKLVAVSELKISDNLFTQVLITPVVDKKGLSLGAAILLHDITAEKTLSQMKEDFTNMMVHELRAPLTAIKQAAALILDKTIALEQEKKEKFIGIIRESSENLLAEVSDLLDAAKLEAGRFSINPLPADISEVIGEQVQFFTPLASNKQVNITFDIEPNLPEIYFDRARIAQVLNNLLSNALKWTREGGRVNIRAFAENGEIKVGVSDNGPGIPADKKSALFSKFSQVRPQGSSGPAGGTGLGLYITKGIIESHGGKIDLESEVGQGTTVTFSLPQKPVLLN